VLAATGRGFAGLALAALAWASPAAAASPRVSTPSETIAGRATTGEGVQRSGPRIVPLRGAPRAVRAREKQTAAAPTSEPPGTGPSTGSALTAGPRAAVFESLNASGLSAAGDIELEGETEDVTPPDTTGAIGPADYVEFVNSEIAAYARADLKAVGSPVSLATFTKGVEPCDPQIKYDPLSERWFYVALRCDGTTTANRLYLGFSKTSDPTDLSTASGHGWCGYEYAFGAALEDYPKLGLDALHIIIGTNGFSSTSESFLTAHIFSLPKPSGPISTCPAAPAASAFGSSVTPLKTSLGHQATTPEPATTADGAKTGYVVAADETSPFSGKGKNIMVWRVGGTAATPTLEALGAPAVTEYTLPPGVPQPSSTDLIDPLDGRLTQAVSAVDPTANGAAIWTQHTVNSGTGGTVVRWYEVIPGSPPTIRQAGTVSDSTGFAFNGAIAPTAGGGAVLNYDTGNSSHDVALMAQSRIGSDTLGTMSGPVTLASSVAIDSDFSCPSQPLGKAFKAESCRWGDYAGASADPANGNLVWGSNQVNGPTGASSEFGNAAQWQTHNFALTIASASDAPPEGSFTPAGAHVLVGEPVEFVAEASDPDGEVSDYYFDFGDSSTAHGATPTHAYAAPGTYTVKLLVTDNAGLVNTTPIEHAVTVKATQSISFTSVAPSAATVGGAPYTVNATGGGSGNPVTFAIDAASSSVCSISGSTVSFIGTGTCTIDANQAGNADYEPAPQVQQSFAVGPAASGGSQSSPGATPSGSGGSPLPPPVLVTVTPNSHFSKLSARVNPKTAAITFTGSVADPGSFSWLVTFPNGKFGVFAAAKGKCGKGQVRLRGRCRPANVIYGRGRKLAAPGRISFTVRPSAAALKAMKYAFKHGLGLPIKATFTFQSSHGGSPFALTQAFRIRFKTR
jgi:PKD repeat protein